MYVTHSVRLYLIFTLSSLNIKKTVVCLCLETTVMPTNNSTNIVMLFFGLLIFYNVFNISNSYYYCRGTITKTNKYKMLLKREGVL